MSHDLHSPRTQDPQAPVVVRFAAVGDVVLLTVLLRALAQRYGRPVHLLSSGAWTAVLLAHDPSVSELRLLSSRRAPYLLTPSQWMANSWLRAHRGPVYLCDPDVWGARVVERAGIEPARLVRAWDHWPGNDIHWADWWLQVAQLNAPGLAAPTGEAGIDGRPGLHVPVAWHQEAAAWLRQHQLDSHPLVLIQPGHKKTFKRGRIGTGQHDKHWPAENWAEVIHGIWARLPAASVLVCGSNRESGLVQEIITACGAIPSTARILNVAAHQPSLERLSALAARAHSMVSVDTGPAHVAGAMDCPLVVLYGQAGWGRWQPRSASSDVRVLGPRQPTDGARLLDLTPKQVLEAWNSLQPRQAA